MSGSEGKSGDAALRWIEAGHTEEHYWRDLWRYRELFLILAWRDVSVRYKQAVAGIAWAVIQPLVTMIIMTVIFSKVAHLPSAGDAPYAITVFAAMLPWQFFSSAVAAAGQSLLSNANMISKVYFPRLIVPGSTVGVSLVDLVVSLGILAALMAWYQFPPTWHLLLLPVLILVAVLTTMGPAMFVTALTVRYRDFRFLIPFMIQVGMYASPVAYVSSLVRDKFGFGWYLVYSCNPLVGIIEGFRWCIIGPSVAFPLIPLLLSLGISFLLFVIGLAYFRKTESSFADII